jgi:hypothetical protein
VAADQDGEPRLFTIAVDGGTVVTAGGMPRPVPNLVLSRGARRLAFRTRSSS